MNVGLDLPAPGCGLATYPLVPIPPYKPSAAGGAGGGGGEEVGGGGGEGRGGGGGGGEDKWGRRVEHGRRLGSSTGCSGEFMFNRETEERQKKKFGIFSELLSEEEYGSCFSPVREEDRRKCGGGWGKVCLSEETRMPALSLQSKEVKGERLLKRTMTMLEEGRRKVDFRGREVKKEIWRGLEEEKLSLTRTRGDEKEVATKR